MCVADPYRIARAGCWMRNSTSRFKGVAPCSTNSSATSSNWVGCVFVKGYRRTPIFTQMKRGKLCTPFTVALLSHRTSCYRPTATPSCSAALLCYCALLSAAVPCISLLSHQASCACRSGLETDDRGDRFVPLITFFDVPAACLIPALVGCTALLAV